MAVQAIIVGIRDLGAGENHTCATRTDGSLWCWGLNGEGQLGDGTTVDRYVPTRVGTGTNWRSASGGRAHTCATKTDGTLRCWGYNAYYQLGEGLRWTPSQVWP